MLHSPSYIMLEGKRNDYRIQNIVRVNEKGLDCAYFFSIAIFEATNMSGLKVAIKWNFPSS